MKIAFLEPLGVPGEMLEKTVREAVGGGPELVFYPDRRTEPEILARRCAGCEAVVLSNFPFGRDVLERCPDLRMICVAFTGTDHVDLEYCRERGIAVCNCAGYSTAAVADLVFGMVVALARNLLPCDAACRAGGTRDGLVGFELEGKTFGVVGAGAIGTRVARIAQAFGCRVLACSRTPKEIPGVLFTDLDTLLQESDVVSLHVPQTPETVGMIGREQFARMKPTALFINTARGPVADTAALLEALENGVIAGAGVDVFDTEPPLPPDHPLLGAPRLICTPHVAFATDQAFEKRAEIVAGNLAAWLRGEPRNLC